MNRIIILTCYIILSFNDLFALDYNIHVKKIWDNGFHCAFTSIIKFQGKYYCSFREGETHIFDKYGTAEGKVRLLVSEDGDDWKPLALISKVNYDLRDPKLSITPDGRLMIIIGGSVYKGEKLVARIPQVSFSRDGISFSDPEPVCLDKKANSGMDWLWRVTWEGNTGYVVNYSMINGSEASISLLKTENGKDFEFVSRLNVSDFPNEATIRFTPDKRMLVMVRRERGDKMGYWGISEPPYKDWSWKKMDIPLGGPDFIVLENDWLIAGTRSRYINGFPKTVLLSGDTTGKFEEVFVLPSGGDTSYTGFLVEGDQLWVSYYSSHETKNAAVYIAKLPLALLKRYAGKGFE